MKNKSPKTPQTAGRSPFHKVAENLYRRESSRIIGRILCPGQKSGQAVSPFPQDQGSQIGRAPRGV